MYVSQKDIEKFDCIFSHIIVSILKYKYNYN